MLTTDIKRKIDSARDILVGKVPDPKAQVDQITNALIYKFMDDMDQEAIELGGKPQFFNNGYEKYSWSKLMDPKLGGLERLDLYVEAVSKLSQNPHIPQLFRDIFKDAYLPYRDPETLSLFLKQINEFTYHHSEELGNSFEYLLSVLGSQGDAGQFRTPRHIIDFIVSVVDPKKTDRILDPACGTAGFLISAYKHILNSHDGKDESGKPNDETRLTPDERKRLANSIVGYDISPDMVKLSRVNMYLHGFPQPHIYEYDSLTSDDRWDDSFDVILANPPFMTPKGGIRPHKRFGVQANRAEVLFTDYIAEHLSTSGRAGVIVPEGIIFQSGNAYKQLRKMLVENYLYAVVSLPSGVFLPYSGVKTSIIFLDKELAKRSTDILFTEVKQVGVSLGAVRKPIKENDLIDALKVIKEFQQEPNNHITCKLAHKVSKDSVLTSDDISLVGNKYLSVAPLDSEYPLISLGDVARIEKGKSSSTKTEAGDYPLILTAQEFKTSTHFDFDAEAVCIPLISATGHGHASIKRVHYFKGKFALANLLAAVIPGDDLDGRYLYWILSSVKDDLAKLMRGAANVSMKTEDLKPFKIPLPTIDIQKEIADELSSYRKVIEGAQQAIDNWTPSLPINPEWEVIRLSELVDIKGGKRIPKGKSFSDEPTKYPYIRVVDMNEGGIDKTSIKFIDDDVRKEIERYTISSNDVYISIAGTIGKTGVVPPDLDGSYLTENAAKLVIRNDTIDKDYLAIVLQEPTIQSQIRRLTAGVGVPKLGLQRVAELEIPLPPVGVQKEIIKSILEERTILNLNRKLIHKFEQKTQNRIADIWG